MATTKATSKKRVRKPAAKAIKQPAEIPVKSESQHEEDANPSWLTAVRAAESKKAADLIVLDLREVTTFADYFVICSGTNPRQVQAIAEEIDVQMAQRGERAASLEGYKNGEWVLADYGDMIVHVFSPKAREFYELERLWRHAKPVAVPAG